MILELKDFFKINLKFKFSYYFFSNPGFKCFSRLSECDLRDFERSDRDLSLLLRDDFGIRLPELGVPKEIPFSDLA